MYQRDLRYKRRSDKTLSEEKIVSDDDKDVIPLKSIWFIELTQVDMILGELQG